MIIPQQVMLWLTSFLWGQALLRTECSPVFENGSFSSPSAESRRFFSDSYCGNLVEFLQVNLIILCGSPYNWIPLNFLTLRLVHSEPPMILFLQFRFCYTVPYSHSSFWRCVSAPVSHDALCLPDCLSILGYRFALRPCLSYGSKKHWFFGLFNF